MNLSDLIKGMLNLQKRIDPKILPSQGLFYKDDFEIFIKKADIEDIIEYEHNYIKDDIGCVINKLKKLVLKNTSFSSNYNFYDLKSIDIIFIFLEIVRFTNNKSISLKYFNDEIGQEEDIEFNSDHFNYFTIDEETMKYYDEENKQFVVNGYNFSLPSIGVENCMTNYLLDKSYEADALKYNSYNYDFTFFLSDKRQIKFEEIDNLITIFNFDLEESETKKIKKIVNHFQPIQKYSLRRGNRVIDISSKIDLEKIWK